MKVKDLGHQTEMKTKYLYIFNKSVFPEHCTTAKKMFGANPFNTTTRLFKFHPSLFSSDYPRKNEARFLNFNWAASFLRHFAPEPFHNSPQ